MHPTEESPRLPERESTSAPSTPLRPDVVDALSNTRKIVAAVVPDEVARREKTYRLAGGGWPVWR